MMFAHTECLGVHPVVPHVRCTSAKRLFHSTAIVAVKVSLTRALLLGLDGQARECQSGLSGTDIAGTFWACAVLKAPVPSGLLPAMETNLVPLISSLTPAVCETLTCNFAYPVLLLVYRRLWKKVVVYN